jgi:hypothetical protein
MEDGNNFSYAHDIKPDGCLFCRYTSETPQLFASEEMKGVPRVVVLPEHISYPWSAGVYHLLDVFGGCKTKRCTERVLTSSHESPWVIGIETDYHRRIRNTKGLN